MKSLLKIYKIIILLSFINCESQGFQYRKVESIPSFISSFDEPTERLKILQEKVFVDITTFLPKKYKTDASVNYTEYIQRGLDENKKVILPNFPILIDDRGLELHSNSVIVFNQKSSIKLSSSNKTNYQILRIHNKKNIVVFSPKIEGDRYSHEGTKGEWGMGISVVSSSNIQIINPKIVDCWGDGIYLGQKGSNTNKNIEIKYGNLDNNRRNAISVISVDGLKMSNIILSNTNGTSPESALDFEPNKNNESLKKIKIKNIYTYNNKINGIVFYLSRLRGKQKKEIDIALINHVDRRSRISIGYSSTPIKGSSLGKYLNGRITLTNVTSQKSKYPFRVYKGTLNENVTISITPTLNKQKYEDEIKRSELKKVNLQ